MALNSIVVLYDRLKNEVSENNATLVSMRLF